MGHSIVGRVREALKSERRMVRVSPWEQNVVAVTGYRLCTSGLIKYVNILTIIVREGSYRKKENYNKPCGIRFKLKVSMCTHGLIYTYKYLALYLYLYIHV